MEIPLVSGPMMIRRLAVWTTVALWLSMMGAPALQAETPEEGQTKGAETQRARESSTWQTFEQHWERYVAYGGLGVGAGLVAAGIGVDTATGGRLDELGEAIERGDRGEIRRLEQRNRRARTTALVLYGTGGVFLIGAGTLLAVDATTGGQTGETAALTVGLGLQQVRFRVAW